MKRLILIISFFTACLFLSAEENTSVPRYSGFAAGGDVLTQFALGDYSKFALMNLGGSLAGEYTLPLDLPKNMDLGLSLRAEFAHVFVKTDIVLKSDEEIRGLGAAWLRIPFMLGNQYFAFQPELGGGLSVFLTQYEIKGEKKSNTYLSPLISLAPSFRWIPQPLQKLEVEAAPLFTIVPEKEKATMMLGLRLGAIWHFNQKNESDNEDEKRKTKQAIAEEKRKTKEEEKARREEEKRRAKEEEELRKEEEKRKLQEEKARKEEEKLKLQEEKVRKAEEERLAEEEAKRKAEEKRLAEEAEKARLEKERLAAEESEKARLEKERLAEEEAKRLAEEERLAKEEAARKAEEERLAEEEAARKAEEKRLAEEAEKARLEKERLAAEEAARKAEEERLAEEEAARLAAEEAEKQRLAEEEARKAKVPDYITERLALNRILFFSKNGAVFSGLTRQQIRQNEKTIDEAVKLIKQHPECKIVIEGYANNISGTEEEDRTACMPLSLWRAEYIKKELIKRGIAADRIETVGKGGANPLASRSDRDNWWKNRRVEFVITYESEVENEKTE